MPYSTLSELPVAVKDHLPKHGQEIFLAAFNSASFMWD
ncbi:ChaB family protein [Psychrobacter celer]